MTAIAYTVICTVQYKSKEEEWLAWLKNGHTAEVIKCGASSAEIVRMDPEHDGAAPGATYEIRYKFDSRGIFEEYLEKHAPRLRREGYELFPPADGFLYRRTSGEILEY